MSGVVAMAGIALATAAALLLILHGTGARPADTSPTTVTVIQGTAPLTRAVDPGAQGIPDMPGNDGIGPSPDTAAGDVAAMENEMAAGHRDQRTAHDQVRVLDIVTTTLPGLRHPAVACAGQLCRISAGAPSAAGSARSFLRSVGFSDAIFALGYAPGPNQFRAQGADAQFLLYLKREG